jgi:antitoxin component YwqK of YwqJK toxin-antitoxin module
MKLIIIGLLIIFPKLIIAQDTIVYDTLFFNNESGKRFEIIKMTGTIENGFKIGLWKSYYDNGILKEQGEYTTLLKKDIKIINHQDCNDCIIDEVAIRNKLNEKYSIETGNWIYYYKNGKIMQSGLYIPIWKIDIRWAEIIKDDGSIENISSGIPVYPQAMQTGVWVFYDEDGKVTYKTTYVEGEVIENTNN